MRLELETGRDIAARLPQFMTQVQVAKKLGISRTLVQRIEQRALFKVQKRLVELLRQQHSE